MGRRTHSDGAAAYNADNGATDGSAVFVPMPPQAAASGDPAEIRVCEYCHRKGRSGDFYSGTKRFCSVGCCHRYSASHQRKRVTKGSSRNSADRPKKQPPHAQEAATTFIANANGLPYADISPFDWQDYLVDCGAIAAPSYCFPPRIFPADIITRFDIGMKLELSGMMPPSMNDCYLVTIDKIFGLHLIMVVDGCGSQVEPIVRIIDSADMHHCGWAKSAGARVVPHQNALPGVVDDWDNYLSKQLEGARLVAESSFLMPDSPQTAHYEVGQKLEFEIPIVVAKAVTTAVPNGTSSKCEETRPEMTTEAYAASETPADAKVKQELSAEAGPTPKAEPENEPMTAAAAPAAVAPAQVATAPAPAATAVTPEAMATDPTAANAVAAGVPQLPVIPPPTVAPAAEAVSAAEALISVTKAEESMDTESSVPAGSNSNGTMDTDSVAKAIANIMPPIERPASKFHVATVKAVHDNSTIMIHIDGSRDEDDLCNVDMSSPFLHPVRYCEEKQFKLQSPQGVELSSFDWSNYLTSTGSKAAPRELFTRTNNMFLSGMKIEAMDVYNAPLVCVATISAVRQNEVLIHFDGWSTEFDYWTEYCSLNIFPIGWCQEHEYLLQTPPDDDAAELLEETDATSKVVGETTPVVSPSRNRKRKSDSSSTSSYSKVARDASSSDITTPKGRNSQSYFPNDKYDGAPRAVFNIACMHGPFLDNNRMDNLPREVCGSSVAVVMRSVLQHLINSGKNPMAIFQEIQSGHSNATVHCNTKNGERFIKHIQHVENHQQLWTAIARLLTILQCCDNFIQPRCSTGRCLLCPGNFSNEATDDIVSPVGSGMLLASSNMAMGTPCTTGDGSDMPAVSPLTRYASTCPPAPLTIVPPKAPSAFHSVNASAGVATSSGSATATPPPSAPSPTVALLANAPDRSPMTWSVADVKEFLSTTDCADQAENLSQQEIDGKALVLLTPDTLVKCMSIRLGPALKICNYIQALKTKWNA